MFFEKIYLLKNLANIFNKMFGDEFLDECDDVSSEQVCCGQYTECNKPCSCRADYWKDQSRVELNKLALSILGESLRNDKEYYNSWKANIAMAFYDGYKEANHLEDIRNIANKGADNFLQNLLYNIKNI